MPSQALQARSLDLDPIIDQIANGAYLRDIARATGIDKRRLSEVLRQHPDYPQAKECAIEVQLDLAEESLASADSDITRAREVWRAATWRAERECPARWGQRSIVAVEHSSPDAAQILGAAADLVRALERRRARVIPGGIVADAPQIAPRAE